MKLFKFILIVYSIIFAEQNSKIYYDIEGNEIIYVDQKWKYIVFPDNDCSIPYDKFVTYIKENTNIDFLNEVEAYKYGIYKMPHMKVCPPVDYKPNIYPKNAEYQIKSNWDSLKVGMKQKKVREWFNFNPSITYKKNKIRYWQYYDFGILEFNTKGRLLKWEFTGSNDQSVFPSSKKENEYLVDQKNNKIQTVLIKIKDQTKVYYSSLKNKILKIFNRK